ncbi:MAG: hypothetical protein K8R21_08260 [Leptospira sp.]|nr:hypothetical protein [Leptospira sp.]
MTKPTKPGSHKKSYIILGILSGIAALLGFFAYLDIYKPFTETIDTNAKSVEILLRSKLLAGLSAGTLFLALAAYFIPIVLKDIDTQRYHKELRNGVLSAGIFFLIQIVLNNLDQKYYLKLAIAIVISAVLFLILLNWILSSLDSKKEQIEIRTAVVGSIVSGILFSILVHFVTVGINYSKKKVDEVVPSQIDLQKKVESLIGNPDEPVAKSGKKSKNRK